VLGDDNYSATNLELNISCDNDAMMPELYYTVRNAFFSYQDPTNITIAPVSESSYCDTDADDIPIEEIHLPLPTNGRYMHARLYVRGEEFFHRSQHANPGAFWQGGHIRVVLPDNPEYGQAYDIESHLYHFTQHDKPYQNTHQNKKVVYLDSNNYPMNFGLGDYAGAGHVTSTGRKKYICAFQGFNDYEGHRYAGHTAVYFDGSEWVLRRGSVLAEEEDSLRYDPFREHVFNRNFVGGTSCSAGDLAPGFYHGTNTTETLEKTTNYQSGLRIQGHTLGSSYRHYHGHGLGVYKRGIHSYHQANRVPSDLGSIIGEYSGPDVTTADPFGHGIFDEISYTHVTADWGRELVTKTYKFPLNYAVHGTRKVFCEKTVIEAQVCRVVGDKSGRYRFTENETGGIAESIATRTEGQETIWDVDREKINPPAAGNQVPAKVTSGIHKAIEGEVAEYIPQQKDTCNIHGIVAVWIREEIHNPTWVANYFLVEPAIRSIDPSLECGAAGSYTEPFPGETVYEQQAEFYSRCIDLYGSQLYGSNTYYSDLYCGLPPILHDPTTNTIQANVSTFRAWWNSTGVQEIIGPMGGECTGGLHAGFIVQPPTLTGPSMILHHAKKYMVEFHAHLGPANTAALKNGGMVEIPIRDSIYTDDGPGFRTPEYHYDRAYIEDKTGYHHHRKSGDGHYNGVDSKHGDIMATNDASFHNSDWLYTDTKLQIKLS
jgi:hypothetical protein